MNDRGLEIAACSYEAAKYAVMNWHYSRAMPSSSLVKYGVWEDGVFIGAVVFGSGARRDGYGSSMGVQQFEACELVRVALTGHRAPVTEIVSRCLRALHRDSPGLRVVVSFADPNHGHHGGIYIAGNWVYLGTTSGADTFIVHGRTTHPRTVNQTIVRYGGLLPGESREAFLRRTVDPRARRVVSEEKYRYAYPLDRAMRRNLRKRALPPPVARGRSIDGDTPAFPAGGTGSTPVVRS